ncbi:MAG: DUF3047 domain-containing protein [Deltaproteobacteria bacterium]|nr:DUF3047 domain-containing protein [Deltaproteobacteria bacterium]
MSGRPLFGAQKEKWRGKRRGRFWKALLILFFLTHIPLSSARDLPSQKGELTQKAAAFFDAAGPKLTAPRVIIEDFTEQKEGEFPSGWYILSIDVFRTRQYLVQREEGEKYLKALYVHPPTTIIKRYRFDSAEYPYLSWKWRVHLLPKGGNELKAETNDAAAGVYVYFQSKSGTAYILKYTWSSTLPVGTVAKNPAWTEDFQTWTVVLESGSEMLNRWMSERVNIAEDFSRIFKLEKAPQVIGIGLLTDADSTGTEAEASYDDFTIIRPQANGS